MIKSRLNSTSTEQLLTIVSQFPPSFFIDVGAARGVVARQLQIASPASRTECFEPWAGNLPHFKELIKGIRNINFHEKAVSNYDGRGSFYVDKIVQSDEKSWQNRIGFSSRGKLIPSTEAPKYDVEKVFEVDVCRLDSLYDDRIRFLKVDAQGGEGDVIEGAERLINKRRVDMIFVKYFGASEIALFAEDNQYVIFDIEYNCIPVNKAADELGFQPGYRTMDLSNGSIFVRGTFSNLPRIPSALNDWMAEFREKNGHFWTNLLLVRKEMIDDFLIAADASGF